MLVTDLHCEHGHVFEGWFASADELVSQKARGLLSCPMCGSHEVSRRPSAPHLNVSALKAAKSAGTRAPVAEAKAKAAEADAPSASDGTPAEPSQRLSREAAQVEAMYLQVVRHVLDHTEDVGRRFAEEARSMHHGDAPERAIRGVASPQERAELEEEGIDVMSLLLPDLVKPDGPLQ